MLDSATQKALEFALKSITAKRQTIKEMRERLSKRFPGVDQNAIIERLTELNYLNDQEFSSAWVRHRSLTSPRGSYVLKSELKRKGVDSEFIDEALESYEERGVLQDLAEKKWDSLSGKPYRQRREKVMRFLISRGFPISEVLDTLEQLAESE